MLYRVGDGGESSPGGYDPARGCCGDGTGEAPQGEAPAGLSESCIEAE